MRKPVWLPIVRAVAMGYWLVTLAFLIAGFHWARVAFLPGPIAYIASSIWLRWPQRHALKAHLGGSPTTATALAAR